MMEILRQKCVNYENFVTKVRKWWKFGGKSKKIGSNLDTRMYSIHCIHCIHCIPAFRRSDVLRRLVKITFYDQDPCAGDSGGPLMYQDPDSGRWVIIGWLEFHFIKNIELRNIALQCECCPVSLFIVNSEECQLSEMYSWPGFCDINVSVHYQLYVKWQLSKF